MYTLFAHIHLYSVDMGVMHIIMPQSYGMIFHMIYTVLQICHVSIVDKKPTHFRNHFHRTPDCLPGATWNMSNVLTILLPKELDVVL